MKRLWIISGTLLLLAILIHFFSGNTDWVEYVYSEQVYPFIAGFLRFSFAWFPVSFGDILYALLAAWFLWKSFKGLKALFKKRVTKERFKRSALKAFILLLSFYLVFNILWGINYNRKGIADQLGIKTGVYTVDELKSINGLLLQKTNENKKTLLQTNFSPVNKKSIFDLSTDAYNEVVKTYPFLLYHRYSVKPSLWGWFGNYAGFTGYYNPFTGEAQVNTTVPAFLLPFTTCHEIAHQLGYAKEDEANFVGYLAAAASKNSYVHYSVYLDLFLYANRNLYNIDSAAARSYAKELLPAVKADLKEWRDFNVKHKSAIEPVIRWIYGKYLQSNQQPSGVLSYDEVTGLLMAYYKKFGKI